MARRTNHHPNQLSLDYEGVNHYWRPMVVMAQIFYRRKARVQPAVAANQCKKRSSRLQGTQLDLLESFYRPEEPVRPAPDPNRPLADIFPMAYPNE